MNKNIILIGAILVFFIASVSIAIAEKDVVGKPEAGTEKNMTYGRCVSAGADLKNTCYDTVKTNLETCKTTAKNQTESKTALKNCNNDYKKAKTQCKTEFKNAKNECKKIKHNVLETMGSAFK